LGKSGKGGPGVVRTDKGRQKLGEEGGIGSTEVGDSVDPQGRDRKATARKRRGAPKRMVTKRTKHRVRRRSKKKKNAEQCTIKAAFRDRWRGEGRERLNQPGKKKREV